MFSLQERVMLMLDPKVVEFWVQPINGDATAMEVDRGQQATLALAARIAEQIVTTVRNAIDDQVIEDMCRAHDAEDSAQMGEPSIFAIYDRGDFDGTPANWEEYRQERFTAMREALRAVGLA